MKDTVDPYFARAFDYEKEAIAYSNAGLRTITYLNAGGLIAMPTAVALFKTDIAAAKWPIMMSAGGFILGLLLAVCCYTFAFFTMAKRSEAQSFNGYIREASLRAFHFSNSAPADQALSPEVAATETNNRLAASNNYRALAIALFFASVLIFIGSCVVGGMAILS